MTLKTDTANRTAIAATLLGLLATITGAQAQEPPECLCSPRIYKLAFNLDQDCPNTNEVEDLPGIVAGSSFQQCSSLTEVARIRIVEVLSSLGPRTTEFKVDPETSGEIDYESVSTNVPNEDKVNFAPISIEVTLFENDSDLGPSSNATITYTNQCGTGPIAFDNSGIGYISITTVGAASSEWCPAPPTVSPSAATSMSYSSSMSISTISTLAKAGKGKAAKKAKTTKA